MPSSTREGASLHELSVRLRMLGHGLSIFARSTGFRDVKWLPTHSWPLSRHTGAGGAVTARGAGGGVHLADFGRGRRAVSTHELLGRERRSTGRYMNAPLGIDECPVARL